jgi:hypothetical protein
MRRQRDARYELIEELRDRIRSLERHFDEVEEYRRRADTIIAQLTQANSAPAARVPELEAPQTSEDGSEGVTEGRVRRAGKRDRAG